MFGVFINFPMRAVLSASHIPWADSEELSYQASVQRWKLVWCVQFVNFQSTEWAQLWVSPSAGGVLPSKNYAPLHSLWLLLPPQETSFPMRKSHLLTTCQGHLEQLHDNHTYFLLPLLPKCGLFLCSFISLQEMDVKRRSMKPTLLSAWGSVTFQHVKGSLAS